MKKLSIIAGLILAPLLSAQLVNQPVQSFQTEAYTSKKKAFVDKLIAKMTLDEKIGQLNLPSSGDFTTGQAQSSDIGKKIEQGLVGGLFNIKGVGKIRDVQKVAVEKSRLKIPMIFGMDVIHGYETTFPIPLGLSASWDMDLIQRSAQIAAQEASADGINWTFSPMVDVSREPRWGRVSEGSGEDPYLGSQIAKAMVYGYQGKDLSLKNTILACVKHFALYGAPEGGRDYNTVDMSHIRMFNEYFPPYKAAVDAGVGSVMASFNEVDGIPATGNKWLMDDVLRKQWGFNGFIVTDYTGINEMIQHGMGDLQQVSALAMNAGIDMDMVGEGFLTTLKKSISEGKVTEQQITTAARRILEAKYDLGLFDDPYRYTDEKRSKAEVFNKANREEARNIAAQSMVLLKNDKQILPLKTSGTVAVIGPLANNNENMTGTWSVASRTKDAVSIMTGLKETIKGVNFIYAKGSNVFYDAKMEEKATMFGKVSNRDSRSKEALLKEAVETAKKADVVVLAIGETAELSGESSSRTNIEIPQAQKDLLIELKKTGKPIVMVLFTGRPLVLNDENKQADAIVNAWFAGSEAGYAIADVLYGKVNPSGKLPMTFPRSVGQVPIYYNAKNTGRPLSDDKSDKCEFEKFRSNYIDECNTPLFPFGFGLSYTSFGYSDVELSKTQLSGNDQLTASITLTNNGKYDGNEVVQLYIRDMVGSVTRPVKELKGFQKVFLKAGESKKVSFTITPEDLKFYNSELKYDWEAGEFDIMIGTNSHDVKHAKINWNK
ncbi:beta-glucosidase BglX [Elizabethkingia anophelis]|nr:beta-glucosidase BglX [Elizabethkingia anophelis]